MTLKPPAAHSNPALWLAYMAGLLLRDGCDGRGCRQRLSNTNVVQGRVQFRAPTSRDPSDVRVNDRFQQAVALHRQGQLARAQSIYEQILAVQPGHFEALHLSGVLAGQSGNLTKAVELIGRALDVEPNSATAHANRAFALKQLKLWEEALAGYDRAIAINPAHADAHLNRGEVLRERQQFDAALASYDRAIEVRPDFPAAYINRGIVLESLGRWQAALESYDRAIAINGGAPEAHVNRGNVLRRLNQAHAALASYEQALALQPHLHTAHFNRGIVLAGLGRWEAALASYDRAIAIKADDADAYHSRGEVLRQLGRWEAALASYDRALAINDEHADAHQGRGEALRNLKRLDAALLSFDRAVAIRPDFAVAHINRGIVLEGLRRWDAAVRSYERAIAIAPDSAEAYVNRGNALAELEQFDAALASHDRALAIMPDCAEAHSNRGNVLKQLNQLDAALASYHRAVAIKPNFAQAHENMAFAALLKGDLENGWAHHEWRWKREGISHAGQNAEFARRLWLGAQPLEGKTILLYSEQGLGDTLQFCRYVELVAKLGATVILEVQKPLLSLMSGLAGVSALLHRGSRTPQFDFQCPLLSLPLAFKTTLCTIPARIPYLRPCREKVLYWQAKLGARRGLRVGLVWSGGFRPEHPELWSVNERRNIRLAKLATLEHPDVEFYSLQKGQPAESELAELNAQNWEGPRLTNFTGELNDFSDTAALIENLDLVISVDTSTAHLAGALGKPVWLLNRFDSCWRWLLDRADSPWYPTLKIYRQETAGHWEGVVQRVRADLARLLESPSVRDPQG